DHFRATLSRGVDRLSIVRMPEHSKLRKRVKRLLIGHDEHDSGGGPRAPKHELRIERFKIQELEEAKIAKQPRSRRARQGDERADNIMPPPLVHVNLHLTTVNRPTSLTFLAAIFGGGLLAQTTQGVVSGRLVNSV